MRILKKYILSVMLLVMSGCFKMPLPHYGFLMEDRGSSLILYEKEPSLVVMYDSVYEIEGEKMDILHAKLYIDTTGTVLTFQEDSSGAWSLPIEDSMRGKSFKIHIETDRGTHEGVFKLPNIPSISNLKDTLQSGDTLYFTGSNDSILNMSLYMDAFSDDGSVYGHCEIYLKNSQEYLIISPDSFKTHITGSDSMQNSLPPGTYNLRLSLKIFYNTGISGMDGVLYGNIHLFYGKVKFYCPQPGVEK